MPSIADLKAAGVDVSALEPKLPLIKSLVAREVSTPRPTRPLLTAMLRAAPRLRK